MKKITITVCLLFLANAMTFCTGADEPSLGDDYYYLPEYEAYDVGYSGGATIYKSPEKNLIRDVKIQGDITNVNHDEDFIITAMQQKVSSHFNNTNSSVKILKYYIIEKKIDSVYGPFNKEGYLQKRKELNIPEELELKEK